MNSMKPFGAETVEAKDDLYYAVHKGIRLANARLLIRLGATDPARESQVSETLGALRSHLVMSLSHLTHENAAIHSALEARCPGAAAHAEEDHEHHEHAFDELEALAQAVEKAATEARAMALRRLYQRFALFVSDDLAHMHEEETQLMPLLMAHFSDEERQEIHHRIVSNIAPEKMVLFMRCMLAALPIPERKEMLDGMQVGMPAEAFDGLMTAVLGTPWWKGDYAAFDRAT
jgi:hypothetical protein